MKRDEFVICVRFIIAILMEEMDNVVTVEIPWPKVRTSYSRLLYHNDTKECF